jgi:hypothetical protein
MPRGLLKFHRRSSRPFARMRFSRLNTADATQPGARYLAHAASEGSGARALEIPIRSAIRLGKELHRKSPVETLRRAPAAALWRPGSAGAIGPSGNSQS